ncbi:GTPase IMAP family member 4 [Takifugu flavidus]|uniref:GTPase IMAP family member 4 n=1 Tax=Takifugu flavidus TaxID=433684 RepID=A0A5C6MH53_9TELE|nr:GTPase IMAP family member 4 [Takifugu flavidus]
MSGSSVTKLCQHGITELTEKQDSQEDGTERRKRKILVVDVPGFGDTSLSGEQILDEVTKCVAVAAPGPHAFLLVVPLGRYTDSENQALCQLAGIFGENAVRRHTVVLFTRGDELEGLEIETYLRDSGNPLLNSLIETCGGRYHVFNNKETGNTLQVEELLMKVDNMVTHTAEGFYTSAMFSEAEAIIREEQERMRERGEADGQSASEEKFRGKGCKRKRSGSPSSPLTNRCRNQSRGTHAGGSREQSLTCWIKAALSPAVLKRIKIVVAAAVTGLVVGATFGAAVPLAAAAGASLTGTTLGITGSAVALGAAVGGAAGGCVGIIAGTEAASAGEAAFNTLQQVSAIGTVAVGLGGAVGLTLGVKAVICAGGVANVASPAARIAHQSVKLIKFADDTTLIGLISNGDETAYRREVARLVSWCGHNNLQLNAQKTVEMIVDFRKVTAPLPPLALMDSPITIVDSFRFLGTTITRDLKWEPTISSLIKKAQ